MTDYEDTRAYIEGEYPGAINDALAILRRHNKEWLGGVPARNLDVVAMDIAGYFTGCITRDGRPRSGRPKP